MWETLFDPAMLDSGKEIAIWCPNEGDAPSLFLFLRENGFIWNDGMPLYKDNHNWRSYGAETTYYLWNNNGRKVITYGDRDCYTNEYMSCMFCASCLAPHLVVEVGDLL